MGRHGTTHHRKQTHDLAKYAPKGHFNHLGNQSVLTSAPPNQNSLPFPRYDRYSANISPIALKGLLEKAISLRRSCLGYYRTPLGHSGVFGILFFLRMSVSDGYCWSRLGKDVRVRLERLVAVRWWVSFVVLAAVVVLWGVPALTESGSPCDSETVVPAGQVALRADCEALWLFYTSLDDPGILDELESWSGYPGPYEYVKRLDREVTGRRWGPDTPLSEWYGVGVENGRVIYLALEDVGIAGEISPALGRLSELEYLRLGYSWNLNYFLSNSPGYSQDRLGGPIPPELAGLTKLRELVLSGVSGSIPPELGNLSNLRVLGLDEHHLSGSIPPELGNLSNLRWLSLAGVGWVNGGLSGSIPPELGQLTKLETLRLRGNQLSGSIPPELGNLTDLSLLLSLSENQLSGPIPPELGRLAKLESLFLGNNLLSGSIPAELGQLRKLKSVLDLSNNLLTGPIPPELGKLTNLGNDRWHPSARLDLSGNQLSGPIPPELGRLSGLTRLDLSGNQLTGPIPEELGRLTKLGADRYEYADWADLDLSNNRLTGPIPQVLGELPSVVEMDLSGNPLSPPWPANLLTPRPGLTVSLPQLVSGFWDVTEGHVAAAAIGWAAEKGITFGVGNDLFGIGQTLTRYEMVTFLCRAFHSGNCTSGSRGSDRFSDVPPSHWANYSVGWAVDRDITRGVSATEFGGSQTLSREQMITFLYRAQGSPTGTSQASDLYEDVPDDRNHWANLPIGWAFDNGVTGGIAEETFGFDTNLSREEMVLFLCRTLAPETCQPSQDPLPSSVLPTTQNGS